MVREVSGGSDARDYARFESGASIADTLPVHVREAHISSAALSTAGPTPAASSEPRPSFNFNGAILKKLAPNKTLINSAKVAPLARELYVGSVPVEEDEDANRSVRSRTSGLPALKSKPAQVWRVLYVALFSVILPDSNIRMCWDLTMMAMLAYISIFLPFQLAFGLSESLNHRWTTADRVVDCFFVVDIFLNFRTAYMHDVGVFEVRHTQIASNYLRGWFLFDVISILPFDIILSSQNLGVLKLFKSARLIKFAKVLRLIKMFKMLRLLRLPRLMRNLQLYISKSVINLMAFVMASLLLTHFFACIFFYTATYNGERSAPWIDEIVNMEHGDKFDLYIASLYWSFQTMTTVGFGDISASSTAERIVSIVTMAIGITAFTYFMSATSTLLSTMSNEDRKLEQRKTAISDFCVNRRLPVTLAERVKKFYEYVISHDVHEHEHYIMTGLSASLRTEVILYLYQEALDTLPFFKNKHPQFIVQLVSHFKLEFYSPGDVVVRQGDYGSEMYFVAQGHLQVRHYSQETDISLVLNTLQTGEVISPPKTATPLESDMEFRWSKQWQDVANKQWRGSMKASEGDASASASGPVSEGWSCKRAPEDSSTSKAPRPKQPMYQIVGVIPEGSIFGEYAMLSGEKRMTTVVALSFCELYCITKKQLDDLLVHWPEVTKELTDVDNMLEVQGLCTPEMKRSLTMKLQKNQSARTEVTRVAFSDFDESMRARARAGTFD